MTQKVITITTTTAIDTKTDDFVETEYPVLNAYLDDGYSVQEIIPVLKPGGDTSTYAITFLLED
jgi:hypothetical protein